MVLQIENDRALRNLRVLQGVDRKPNLEGVGLHSFQLLEARKAGLVLPDGALAMPTDMRVDAFPHEDYRFPLPEMLLRLRREQAWEDQNLPPNPFQKFIVSVVSQMDKVGKDLAPYVFKMTLREPTQPDHTKTLGSSYILDLFEQSPYFQVYKEKVGLLPEMNEGEKVGFLLEEVGFLLLQLLQGNDKMILSPAKTLHYYEEYHRDEDEGIGTVGFSIPDCLVVTKGKKAKVTSQYEIKTSFSESHINLYQDKMDTLARDLYYPGPYDKSDFVYTFVLPNPRVESKAYGFEDIVKYSQEKRHTGGMRVAFLLLPFTIESFYKLATKNGLTTLLPIGR